MYKIIITVVLQFSVAISVKLTRMTHHIDFGPDIKSDTVLISDNSNFASPGLVYGVCNVNLNSSEFFNCKMFMETKEAVGTSEHVHSCNVTVKRLRPGHTVHRSVVALDDDTAVLIPREYNSSSLTFIHFPDCRMRIVDLDYDLSSATVLAPLDNTFDLIRVEGDDTCFSDCRVIMDFNGSVILKAHKWLRHYLNEYAAMKSPTRGRLLVSTPSIFSEPVLQISAVDDNGDIVVLKTYPTIAGSKIAASTTHQLLSACATVNLNVTCGQFDFTGFRMLETNVTFVELSLLHSINVFNLPEGGLLLLYSGCSSNSTEVLETNCEKHLFVKKIDISGKHLGSIEITQFREYADLEKLHFFVNEDNSLCFSQPSLADSFKDNGQLILDIVCFENTEFTV